MGKSHRRGQRTALLATALAAIATMATAGDASAANPDLIGLHGPRATRLPAVTGTPRVGRTVRCSPGTWTGSATFTFTHGWRRDGHNIVSVQRRTLRLKKADAGHGISCRVTVRSAMGTARATSHRVDVRR
jgi:hypothetical protein